MFFKSAAFRWVTEMSLEKQVLREMSQGNPKPRAASLCGGAVEAMRNHRANAAQRKRTSLRSEGGGEAGGVGEAVFRLEAGSEMGGGHIHVNHFDRELSEFSQLLVDGGLQGSPESPKRCTAPVGGG